PPITAAVAGEVAVAAAERAAPRPGQVADIADLGIIKKVWTDEVVAVTAIRDLLNDADAGAEGLPATAAIAAIPDMMGSLTIRTAIEVSSVGRAGQRNKQP
ncbi:MAG: hypothetical protein WB422_02495, partial [Pseudolabrys sp.]